LVVLVVVAVLVLGTRGSFGLYIAPWEELFGVGRASVSLISAAGFLTYGFAQPVAGKLLEHFAPRIVIGFGLSIVAAGLAGAALSTDMWMALISIGLIVWSLNWIICFFGARLAGLDAGYIPGLISGSYTVTAVMGVAQGAVQSGAFQPPDGVSAEQVGANMAAGYAISYIISSIGIILLIRYLPQMFGRDPVADAKAAEEEFSGGGTHAVPGAPGSLAVRTADRMASRFRRPCHARTDRCDAAPAHTHPQFARNPARTSSSIAVMACSLSDRSRR